MEWKRRYDKQQPKMVDTSKEVEDSADADDANIEVTEKFCVYYPDGSINEYSGGLNNHEQFKNVIHNAQINGYDLEWQCDMKRELVADATKGDVFVMANLLQFPYGRGGFDELRQLKNGHKTRKTDIDQFVVHLSSLSQPEFHRPLHSLMLYNLSFKSLMLRSAACVIENGKQAANIVNGLNAGDFERAVDADQCHTHGGSAASRKYLRYVKAVAASLPHSNEASGKAQMKMEAMCHNLGPPHTFLTVTYDDDNSFLLQAFSGCAIDDDTPITTLSDEELRARATRRTELRLKYPGLAAFVLDEVLDIILEEVVGWNRHSNKTTGRKGLFGNCFA